MQRESRAIHSYMGAYLTAVTADLKKDDEANPYVLRALSALANAVSETVRRSIASLHQVVLHRLDMRLWILDSRSSAIGLLRHTPILGRSTLYRMELMNDISTELGEDDRHSAIAMAVRKVLPFYLGQRQAKPTKRRVPAPAAQRVPPQKRSKETPRKTRPKQPISRRRKVHPSLRSIGDYRFKYRERPIHPSRYFLSKLQKLQDRSEAADSQHFWTKWPEMGASRRAVRWLRFGMSLWFNRKVVREGGHPKLTLSSPPHLVTCYRDQVKQDALHLMVAQLLQNQYIREMSPTECGVFSRVFLVPKRWGGGGGWRLVIDLLKLNEYLTQITLQMDLFHACHHVPMQEDAHVYICFKSKTRETCTGFLTSVS